MKEKIFSLSGDGKINDVLEIFENDASLLQGDVELKNLYRELRWKEKFLADFSLGEEFFLNSEKFERGVHEALWYEDGSVETLVNLLQDTPLEEFKSHITVVGEFKKNLSEEKGGDDQVLPRTRGYHFSEYKKIILSSAGRSGSTAVKEYLREFDDVFLLPNEWALISESYGLADMWGKIEEGALTKVDITKFLCLCVFGVANPKSKSELLQVIKANELLPLLDVKYFFRASVEFAASMWKLSKRNIPQSLALVCYKNLTSDYVNSVLGSVRGCGKHTKYLFSNVVSVDNMHHADFLGDGYLIPVFRDPRSLHVAKKIEKHAYSKNVKSMVSYYGLQRKRFGESLEVLCHSFDVRAVNFEEFVCFEGYRLSLAMLLGLNFDKWRKYDRFKPWESRKNVFIHNGVLSKKEEAYIRESLPKYCEALERIIQLDEWVGSAGKLKEVGLRSDGIPNGVAVKLTEGEEGYRIKNESLEHYYISVGEPWRGFSSDSSSSFQNSSGVVAIQLNASSSKVMAYLIGYQDGKRIFTQKIASNKKKKVVFPELVERYRVFLRVSGLAEVENVRVYLG